MTFRSSRSLWILAFLCLATSLWAATPVTYLYLNSQPGDYIGGGVTQTFTPSDGTFSISNFASQINVSFHTPNYSQSWYLDFGSPLSMKFGRGQYVNAERTPFRGPTRAGIDVSGDGRGCNTDTGQFLVTDFALATDGTVARFAIDFEQHCEGAAPALYGSFRYNSSVTAVPRFGLGSAYTLKGNAGSSDSAIIVALSMPALSQVTVQYATADATAVQGVDYVATAGTATFPAGATTQIVSVPVLGDRLARGNKSFKVRLSSPAGGGIGAPAAAVLIRDPNIPQTVLAMSSQPGDYIGAGQQYLITISDAVFTPSNSANVITVSEQNGDYWTTDFAGPSSSPITSGEYLNAQRFPFQPAGTPGLSVYGAGRGCNTLTGNFDVLKANYSKAGVLKAFSVNFEQHCEGQTPALFGWLRLHSLLEQFSVSDAVIVGSTAEFTVTVNPALSSTVSVTFSTADGTAIAGTDYAATTQTVSLSPGMLQQTVSVPLLSSGNTPKKTFYGTLSAPTGAAVWVGRSSATF